LTFQQFRDELGKGQAARLMNYRHAFHAGNFADVHKHAILTLILVHLLRKPAAFRVIDTHAGAGRYYLFAAEPTRGGEWRYGIARIWDAWRRSETHPLLAPYLEAVRAFNPDGQPRFYPGSATLAQYLLRSQDRLIACEIEPQSAASLGGALRGDTRAKALAIDGWVALGAYVPPRERRGVVLIDLSFEDAADFTRLSAALSPHIANGQPASTCSGIRSRAAGPPMRWRTSCESLRCQSFIAANSRSVRRVPMPVSSGPA
jgi:23S rRNA (adenine2030-N6)-methyltransferase